jgi:hypothetical protein
MGCNFAAMAEGQLCQAELIEFSIELLPPTSAMLIIMDHREALPGCRPSDDTWCRLCASRILCIPIQSMHAAPKAAICDAARAWLPLRYALNVHQSTSTTIQVLDWCPGQTAQ